MAGFTTTALLALTAVQGVNQYVGQRRMANATEQAGRAEGRLLDFNAAQADLQAADALARGREAEGRQRTAVRQLGGAQRAALAASGVDVNSGSAIDVQADSQALGEADALAIRNNARREAYGFQVQATDLRLRARGARAGAANMASAARMQSVGTLLSTGASLYGVYSGRPRTAASTGGRSVPTVPARVGTTPGYEVG